MQQPYHSVWGAQKGVYPRREVVGTVADSLRVRLRSGVCS